MSHFSVCASTLRLQAAMLSASIAVLGLVSAASALDLDFHVASGNFTTTGNWIDTTNPLPNTVASPIPVAAAAAPTLGDNAFVRNGGAVTINTDVATTQIRIGASYTITNPDYDGSTVVDAGDYVLWRKGGPIQYDPTPGTVGPDDYTLWRYRYGGSPLLQNIGGSGSLNWTAGEITGVTSATNIGGPDLRVGTHVNISASNPTEYDFPGTVVQNGPTTKIILYAPESKLNIGDSGTTPTPTSSYTLANGTIGLAIGGSGISGANGNDGIAVKNGYFTMTGGQIIDATPDNLKGGTLTTQRFMTIGNQSGNVSGAPGTENYAKATFTGGTVDVLGGFRIAPSANSRGYLTINGPVTITTGGDTSIGYNATNGVGQMDMSAGTLTVGRTYTDPITGTINSLTGRFQVGQRGRGTLNMSGGTINVTRDVRVGAEYAAGGSLINQTGGTINATALIIGVANTDPLAPGYVQSSIILDGPTASFNQLGSGGAVIGYQGKGLFEVRQGTATLGASGSAASPGFVNVGLNPASEATINVKGGKLILAGTLGYTLASFPTTPPVNPVNLTGGTLEFNNPLSAAAQSWQPSFTNAGSKLVLTQGALRQVVVGSVSPAYPSDWSMTSGSWDVDLGLHTVLGADWFNVTNGAGALTGGTINVNYLSGFTPNVGEVFRILRAAKGTTLGAMTITGAGAGSWVLQEAPIVNASFPLDEEIQLKYVGPGAGAGLSTAAVPEPSTAALLVIAAAGLLTARRNRSLAGAQQN